MYARTETPPLPARFAPQPERPASPKRTALRIRTVGRFDAASAPGGGEIQMLATTAALAAAGHDARPWRPWEDPLRAGDVVHFFGSRPEFLPLVETARRVGARVAVSTIAWFDWRNTLREPGSPLRRAAATARYALRAACPRLASWRRRLYHAADVLLPNSQAEAEQLMRLFDVPPTKIRVVPNGADPRFAKADPAPFRARFGLDRFVLCPARIEPRKNQRTLIRALRGTGIAAVLIGDVVPGHEAYAERCRREADANVRFLGRLEHDDPLLASAYAACSCLALVGWYETPGLAAIEAALTGAPLVLPRGGCAAEYFGPAAEYVGPHDPAAMRRAVLRAVERGRDPALAELMQNHFTWRHAAEATAEAYAHLG